MIDRFPLLRPVNPYRAFIRWLTRRRSASYWRGLWVIVLTSDRTYAIWLVGTGFSPMNQIAYCTNANDAPPPPAEA